jgi:catechol 2,3-dioxygenase-like lactoylglutathione lyase family enzyme
MNYFSVQMKYFTFPVLAILSVMPVRAQLVEPNQIGVRMGHVHLAVKDVAAQKHFWVSVMDGTLVKNGPLELIQFPGVFILLSKADAAAPPAGSIVDHFGFVVKDMPGALARWKDANITTEPTGNPNEVFVIAPDGIRLEVYGEPALPTPVSMNHIHFYLNDIPAIKAWYVKAFGANPGRRPCIGCLAQPRMIETDDLPGVNLSFSLGNMPPAPTKGRSIDHIGFEVTNLEGFVRGLETRGIRIEGPIRMLPNTTIKVAFLTDPWGTYIELTEGLAPQ